MSSSKRPLTVSLFSSLYVSLVCLRLDSQTWCARLIISLNPFIDQPFQKQNTWKCCMNFTLYFLNRSDGMAHDEKLFVWMTFLMTVVYRRPKYEEVAYVHIKIIITRYTIDSNLGLPMKDYILNYNCFYSSHKVI